MTGLGNPLKWARQRVAVKAAVLFVSLYLCFAAGLLAVNVLGEKRQQTANAYALAHAYAARAESAAGAQGGMTAEAIARELNRIYQTQDVLAVRVVDPQGRALDSRGAGAGDTAAEEAALAKQAIESGAPQQIQFRSMAMIARPLMDAEGAPEGAVLLGVSMAKAHAAVNREYWQTLIVTLFGLGLAIPITGLFLSRALRPVLTLTQAAKDAARGKLDVRVHAGTGDELDALASSFNTMLDRLKHSLEHVRRLAYSDHLTGLPNKSAFAEHARRVLQGEAGHRGAMFLIDLDRFKRLNDTLGARAGDKLIRMVGERMQKIMADHIDRHGAAGRSTASTAPKLADPPRWSHHWRTGGPITGEPVVPSHWRNSPQGGPFHLAGDRVAAIAEPFDMNGQRVVVSGSVGMALFPEHGAEPDPLMQNANLALDAAKKSGGGAYRVFDEEMTRAAVERMKLESDLRRAIDRKEFIVHYQPKAEARTGAAVGCEALIRWKTPSGEIVSPGRFIGVAEETGLIAEMGDIVLRESCLAAARWRQKGVECPVSVNVSALQFERDNFGEMVREALEAAQLPAHLLELEITESVAMTDPERARAQIQPLKSIGVRFAIDDFGTGHSSLSHLTQMPFDTFKIDRCFVQDLDTQESARVIVQTILALARSLQLEVVAEGAETAEQVAMLQSLGCNVIQGFYFARPMPEKDMLAFAQRGQTTGEQADGDSSEIIRLKPRAS